MKSVIYFPVLMVIIPTVTAVIILITGRKSKRISYLLATLSVFIVFLMSIFVVLKVYLSGPFSYYPGGWKTLWGIEIFFDYISAYSLVLTFTVFLVLLFSFRYTEKMLDEEKIYLYYGLILLNLVGMIGFVSAGDLFNLFIFMEILSLSAYALTAIAGQKSSEVTAFRYLLLGALSSLVILMAIVFLYSITGTLSIKYLALRLAKTPYPIVASAAFAFLVAGFSLKGAAFPLHIWLPDAHSVAPSPVSAILSGLVVKMGAIGLLRTFQIYRLSDHIGMSSIATFLSWLGIASIFIGGFFALFQDDIKRILAYSTISNMGYIYLGLGLTSYSGMVGGVIHIFEHGLTKTLLFLSAGAIIYRTGSQKLSDLEGVGHKMPVTATAMAIGIVSIIGFPPTNGFVGKWLITIGAIQAGKTNLAVIMLFGTLPILLCFLKVANIIFFKPLSAKMVDVREVPLSMCIPMVLLGGLLLLFGILAYLPLSFAEKIVLGLLGR